MFGLGGWVGDLLEGRWSGIKDKPIGGGGGGGGGGGESGHIDC